jgi:formate--tetrahydrofolate ligase
MSGLKPSAVVIVATARAMKYHGGVAKADLNNENLEALAKGMPNLLKHVDNIKNVFKLPCVVAVNKFPTDTEAELKLMEEKCKEMGVNVKLSEVWAKGGEEVAKEVLRLIDENDGSFEYAYDEELPMKDKIRTIAKNIYGADDVTFTDQASKEIAEIEKIGYGKLPICMAKTQYSLSDDAGKIGRPTGFNITIRQVTLSAGAGFVVAITGSIMKMPGLPKVPSAEKIDVDNTGKISGLF